MAFEYSRVAQASGMSDALWRALEFSPETFGPDLFALCRMVPDLDHLLCRLDHIHDPTYPEDRVLRYYQRDLALDGFFEVRLPYTRAVLRSGRSVMLADKSVFFGVAGRRDIILAAARVGFTLPLSAVVLPLHRAVITLHGTRWNIDTTAAQRAVALFEAACVDWGEPAAPSGVERLVVTGDANYAHHLWNQLGALEALLARCNAVTVLATHQPIAPLTEIFADHPRLNVIATPPDALSRVDPRTSLPFGVAGKMVMRSVCARILQLAERRASPGIRDFLRRTQDHTRIWLTLRAQGRTALNLFDALIAVAGDLLRDERFAIVFDGYSRPNDYATNRDYHRPTVEGAVAREGALAHALVAELTKRIGPAAKDRIFVGVGCDLLDSLHLAANCHAYFAHHGTIQHKIGYFTTVPGMAHTNPGILAGDPAGGHRHVSEDPGLVEYLDASLVEEIVATGGQRLDPNNAYRFKNIAAVNRVFREFLSRQGLL
jgi:hypothetical protein